MIQINKNLYKIYISEKIDGNARNFTDFQVCRQIHSDKIVELNNDNIWTIRDIEADWIITNLKNTKIWVLLADCNWVIFVWKEYIWAVHAGWKWLKSWIIEKIFDLFLVKNEKIEDIQIFVWPSIRSCCYEVWEEFNSYFEEKYLQKRNWKIYLDMKQNIEDRLEKIWIKKGNIEIFPECTHCNEKFYSYRKWDKVERIIVGIEKT